jgi:hypothetical protein
MLKLALGAVACTLVALGSVPSIGEALGAALLGGSGMVVGEVLSETALPRMLGDDVLGRAYGLVVPASLGGIVAGSLAAGPLVAAVGVQGALTAAGVFVFVTAGLLLWWPLDAHARATPAPARG